MTPFTFVHYATAPRIYRSLIPVYSLVVPLVAWIILRARTKKKTTPALRIIQVVSSDEACIDLIIGGFKVLMVARICQIFAFLCDSVVKWHFGRIPAKCTKLNKAFSLFLQLCCFIWHLTHYPLYYLIGASVKPFRISHLGDKAKQPLTISYPQSMAR